MRAAKLCCSHPIRSFPTVRDCSERPRGLRSMKRTVEGRVHYTGPMAERPRYYANDHSRDVLALEERTILIDDAREQAISPTLETEGFVLIKHRSAVEDFRNAQEVV